MINTAPKTAGIQFANDMRREAKAHNLIDALIDCDREDRVPFVEALLNGLSAGAPIPAFGSIMDEANFWADMASRPELKAYCAACFVRLSEDDQRAFLAFAEGRKSA